MAARRHAKPKKKFVWPSWYINWRTVVIYSLAVSATVILVWSLITLLYTREVY